MENEVEAYNKKQFMRLGMNEFYDDEIKKQLKLGAIDVFLRMPKEFEGNAVQVDVYLKKQQDSERYDIKKFELELQKAWQENKINHMFYIGEPKKIHTDEGSVTYRQNRYTLKEAYNLLSGRPVHKQLVSKEGRPFEAWVKLDLKSKLANGNHETNFFTDKYGFNLEKTLKEYPVKELDNSKYTVSLIESLQRGNLQSVTFKQKDGTEEKLFISPNIKMGALNVYDENKKQVPTQQLVERDLISKVLGERLLQSEKQRQEQKQDITEEHKQKHKQKIN